MLKLAFKSEFLLRHLGRLPKSKQWLFVKFDHLERITDDAVAEQAYRQVANADGITKQTHRGRFAALTATTLDLLRQFENPRIHDIGVSSGITSVELYLGMKADGIAGSLYVSDKYAQYHLYRASPGRAIVDTEGTLIAAYWGWLYADAACSDKYPISKWLLNRARAMKMDDLERTVVLFHPELLREISTGAINHIDFDILELSSTFAEKFEYIRCMNLLNHSYFSESDLLRGLENITRTLVPGGILQVGRTDQNLVNNVTFYRMAENGYLTVEAVVGEGSEMVDIVEKYNQIISARDQGSMNQSI